MGEQHKTDSHDDSVEQDMACAQPITLERLIEELRWPALLRAGAMGLRADRLVLALIAIVAAAFVGGLPALWMGGPGLLTMCLEITTRAITGVLGGIVALDGGRVLGSLRLLVLDGPIAMWEMYGFATMFFGVPMFAVLLIASGAIARSAACEFAQGVHIAWPRALGFAIGRWDALAGAVLGPLGFVVVIIAAVSLGGLALLSLPGLSLVGAVLYPIALVAGLLAAVTLLGYALFWPLLVPAVACEATDGWDATQRASHYLLHRPLTLVVSVAIASVVGIVAVGVADLVMDASVGLTTWAASLLTGQRADAVIAGTATGGLDGAAATIIGFWNALPGLLVGAYAMSVFFSGSTILYLVMREAVDGQHRSEIWMPGLIEGTMVRTITDQTPEAMDNDASDE